MSSYYKFKGSVEKYLGAWEGFWEALFVFNPFIAGENPGVTDLIVVEEVCNIIFKLIGFFLVASDSDVPQRNCED